MKCNHCHNRVSKKESICPHCGKEIIDNKKKSFKEIILIVVIIFGSIFSPRAIRMINRGPGLQNNKVDYSSMSFDEILSKKYDKDSTVLLLNSKSKLLKEYLENNGYTIVSSSNSAYEKNNSLRAMTFYRVTKNDDVYYNVSIIYEKGLLSETELSIDCIKSIENKDNFYISKDIVNDLSQHLLIDNAYSLLSNGYMLLERNDDVRETYEYISEEKYKIILKEIVEEQKIRCNYSLKYEVN